MFKDVLRIEASCDACTPCVEWTSAVRLFYGARSRTARDEFAISRLILLERNDGSPLFG